MWGIRWLLVTVVLAALTVACTGGQPSPKLAPGASAPPSPAPSTTDKRPASEQTRLEEFLDRADVVTDEPVDAKYDLYDVRYTSSTDAAAEFGACSNKGTLWCTTVIATTDDNWAHAATITIDERLADLVTFIAVGRGAVAIKATNQITTPRRFYPPFVLYPDGTVNLLHVAEDPQPLQPGHDVLVDQLYDFHYDVGRGMPKGTWAIDIAAAHTYQLPPGSVPSRHNRLPWDGEPKRRYADTRSDLGPGTAYAIAMNDSPQDLPLYLRELWSTDAKAVRRVPLPRDRMVLGGLAFAPDKTLLVAEGKDPLGFCGPRCRPGRIWRLPFGSSTLRPDAGAPRLAPWNSPLDRGLHAIGAGPIVGYVNDRTVVISTDGRSWTKVTPGR
ncbi:hypothetical protein [Nocardioides iriomotensis]|uniref:Uncharacterized protein n=1 Tax=Nocardioides iriomotensis TaxID=715784 RepID=A0A4V1Z2C7_9ACTN|nr:hypothetical protein [Nocardioides iriomotensis]RYU13946.1 hypothetical protein ETU37_05345 [Nocardioides iriomotensis]